MYGQNVSTFFLATDSIDIVLETKAYEVEFSFVYQVDIERPKYRL